MLVFQNEDILDCVLREGIGSSVACVLASLSELVWTDWLDGAVCCGSRPWSLREVRIGYIVNQ